MNTIPDFLSRFESRVIIPGIQKGIFNRREVVPLRIGKLAHTEFGRIVGSIINYEDLSFVISYYEHYKRSTGFMREVTEMRNTSPKSKSVWETYLVHFASIKDEHIRQIIGDDREFLGDFFFHKQKLVSLRFGVKAHEKK